MDLKMVLKSKKKNWEKSEGDDHISCNISLQLKSSSCNGRTAGERKEEKKKQSERK